MKWLNDSTGFGFITPDGGGKDVFVHHTAIQAEGFRSLAEGQKVEYEVTQGPKGSQAMSIDTDGPPAQVDVTRPSGLAQPSGPEEVGRCR